MLQTKRSGSVDLAVTERIRIQGLRDVDAVVRAERADLAFRRRHRGADIVLDVDLDRFELLAMLISHYLSGCRANLPVISLAAGNEPTTPEITVSIGVNFSSRLHNLLPE